MQLHSVNFMGRFPLVSKCTASQSTVGDKQCQVSTRARVEGSSGEQVEQKIICIFRLPKTYTLRGKPRFHSGSHTSLRGRSYRAFFRVEVLSFNGRPHSRQQSTRPPGVSLLTRKDTAFPNVLPLQEINILSCRQEVVS